MGKRGGLDVEAALHLGALLPFSSVINKKQHVAIKCLLKQKKIAVETKAMIDSGATGLFIDEDFANRLGLKKWKKKRPVQLTLFDGSYARDITHQISLDLDFSGVTQKLVLNVTTLSHYAIVLGLPWLKAFNPLIDWRNETVEVTEEGELTLAGVSIDDTLEEIVPKELHEFLDVFSEEEAKELPPHRSWDMKIELEPGARTDHRVGLYNLNEEQLAAQKEWIDEHLAKGFIQKSKSPMTTSTFFVKKKDDLGKQTKMRIVVDYRHLNNMTIKDRYPIPLIGNLTDQLSKAKFFTKMDLRYGYHLVRIAEGDEWKTAFSTRHGQFEYKVMPLGLCNAPAVFQRMMNTIFYDMLDRGVIIYLDDILIYGETEEELRKLTLEVLKRLRKHKLFVKPGKCRFKVQKVDFLGVIVTPGSIEMDPGKVDAIRDWPAPTKVKEMQSFLGFCNFYRRFIPDYSTITRPLHGLAKKNVQWKWTQQHQVAFQTLKEQFQVGRVLVHPDPSKPFFVECDSSGYAIGGELSQYDDKGIRRAVAFFSKSMQPAERNYDIHDRELLSIIRTFQQWRHYLEGARHTVTIMSDHKNLEIFRTTKVLTPRQARWAEFLSGFDFVIKHQSGKAAARSDTLSRRPDHKPHDHPELINRIFKDEHFAGAIRSVAIESETEILKLIKSELPNDETVAPEIQFITTKKKPFNDWTYENGLLRKKGKIYVPALKELRTAVLHQHHDRRIAGHKGPKATTALIQRKYWWPGMAKTIEDYVQGCDICQRAKARTHAPYGPLEPLPTPDRKWSHISYDFITGLPLSEGKDSILVVVDRFSKGIHLIPCKEEGMTAEVTARLFLDNVWKLHGTPETTISDRGTQFNNEFIRRLYELLGIHPNFSTAYHPETDGQTERINQIVEQYLRMFVNDRQDDWVKLLPLAEFSYNNAASSTTGNTPFFLWYGEHPTMEAGEPREEKVPVAEELAKSIKDASLEAKAMINMARERYKEQADKSRLPDPEFAVGEKVWLSGKHLNSDRPSKKLDWKYYGPYKVIERIGRRAYKLELPRTVKVHPVFHVSLLEKQAPDNFDREPQPIPPVIIEGEEEWEVEKILASRKHRNKRQFKIRWKGFQIDQDSWESESNVEHAQELIDEFYNQNPNAYGAPSAQNQGTTEARSKGGVLSRVLPRPSAQTLNPPPAPNPSRRTTRSTTKANKQAAGTATTRRLYSAVVKDSRVDSSVTHRTPRLSNDSPMTQRLIHDSSHATTHSRLTGDSMTPRESGPRLIVYNESPRSHAPHGAISQPSVSEDSSQSAPQAEGGK